MPVLADELARLQAHRWQISDIAFSPDGSRLASAGWDKEVNVWELSDLEKVTSLTGVHQTPITSVSWLRPNGAIICTGSADHTAALWNSESGMYLSSLTEHNGWVLGTDFSASGAYLATASWDRAVRIWDPGSQTLINTLSEHTAGVWDVRFNPTSYTLCSASEDGTVRVWDARTNRPVAKLSGGHSDAVYSVAWSPEGSILASGSADNKICIWEPRQQAVINTIYAHQDNVKSLAFNPQTENMAIPVLVSAGGYNISLSDPRPSHRADILSLSLHQKGKEVEAVTVSPDGSLIVSGGRDGRIVLMTLMVPSIIPRSESKQTDLTSSVLRKSRVIRDRSYIYDVTSDGDIPPELVEDEDEEGGEEWLAQQLEAAEMRDTLSAQPKKVERQTSLVRRKRRSRFEEKETELPDYATEKKKGVSAKKARGRRAKGKSFDIPTMVAHLSAAVKVYGPEEPNSSSESDGEEGGGRGEERKSRTERAKVNILSHIKAWSNPEAISVPPVKHVPKDIPDNIGKAKLNKELFEAKEHAQKGGQEGEDTTGQTEEEYLTEYSQLVPSESQDSMLQSTSFDTESLLHESGQYSLGNSYRLEDLMTANSEELLPQWSSSPLHGSRESKGHSRGPHYNPTLPTQLEQEGDEEEEEEDDDDSIPMSMI